MAPPPPSIPMEALRPPPSAQLLMSTLAREVMQKRVLTELTAQGVANLFWAYAKLRFRSQKLLGCLMGRIMQPGMLDTLTPQGTANVIWAFAKLEVYNAEVMATLSEHVVRTAWLFGAQGVANIAWAFARLDVRDAPLMEVLVNARRGPGDQADSARGGPQWAREAGPVYATPPPARSSFRKIVRRLRVKCHAGVKRFTENIHFF